MAKLDGHMQQNSLNLTEENLEPKFTTKGIQFVLTEV